MDKSAVVIAAVCVLLVCGASLTGAQGSSSGGSDRGGGGSERTLRCYVCGAHKGIPCEDISPRRRSPYRRPTPQLTSDGRRQFENCTDLINNKACIKQVVNGGNYATILKGGAKEQRQICGKRGFKRTKVNMREKGDKKQS